jgi:hypothetical protein
VPRGLIPGEEHLPGRLRPDLFQKLDGVIGDLAVEGLGVGLSGGDIQRPVEGKVAVLLRP